MEGSHQAPPHLPAINQHLSRHHTHSLCTNRGLSTHGRLSLWVKGDRESNIERGRERETPGYEPLDRIKT